MLTKTNDDRRVICPTRQLIAWQLIAWQLIAWQLIAWQLSSQVVPNPSLKAIVSNEDIFLYAEFFIKIILILSNF